MKIIINGINGHMGRVLADLALSGYAGAKLVLGIDVNEDETCPVSCVSSFDDIHEEADCIIDFSHHSCTEKMTAWAQAHHMPLVIATTGQTDEERAMITAASEHIPVFFAANYSIGVALLMELAAKTASVMQDAEIEIVETHHDRKLDAPSGTALSIARAIQQVRPEADLVMGRSGNGKRTPEEIGIHSIRMGNIVGIHEVIVGTQNQTIILKHEAHSRALFAEGALTAAKYLTGKPAGLYDMKNLIVI